MIKLLKTKQNKIKIKERFENLKKIEEIKDDKSYNSNLEDFKKCFLIEMNFQIEKYNFTVDNEDKFKSLWEISRKVSIQGISLGDNIRNEFPEISNDVSKMDKRLCQSFKSLVNEWEFDKYTEGTWGNIKIIRKRYDELLSKDDLETIFMNFYWPLKYQEGRAKICFDKIKEEKEKYFFSKKKLVDNFLINFVENFSSFKGSFFCFYFHFVISMHVLFLLLIDFSLGIRIKNRKACFYTFYIFQIININPKTQLLNEEYLNLFEGSEKEKKEILTFLREIYNVFISLKNELKFDIQ
jgi:hypothetical protein